MFRNNRDGKIFIDPLTFPHAIRVFMVDIGFTASTALLLLRLYGTISNTS